MAKDKERSINPAQQARKQEKNRALKKAKTEQQSRRNEKFARRNPDRIQRQIDDLKALEASGEIKPREKAILADLERDLQAVQKAREALGEKAPTFGNARPRNDHDEGGKGRSSGSILGKRGRDEERRQDFRSRQRDTDSGEDTDESVRAIPLPRDTPPPIPHEFRRNNHSRYHQQRQHQDDQSANADSHRKSTSQTTVPPVEVKTTYSAAPQLRDLRKEATSRFVPTAVKQKQNAVKGVGGGLLEPEELDRLEEAGYYKPSKTEDETPRPQPDTSGSSAKEDAEARRLAEEEALFEQEMAAYRVLDNEDIGMVSDSNVMEGDRGAGHRDRPASGRDPPTRSRNVQIEEVEDEDL